MNNLQKIVVSGILETKDGVLLAKRPLTKKIASGKYHLPGGHVEFGEDPKVALKREFLEELALVTEVVKIIDTFSYQENNSHTVGISYQVTASVPEKINFNKEDVAEVVWVKDESELNNFFPKDDHDYKILQKFFLETNRF